MKRSLRIHTGEQIGDGDLFWTALCAVTAGRTGDQILRAENFTYLVNSFRFRIVKRLRTLHEGKVILHLFDTAHSREDHPDSVKACDIAQRVACRTAAVKRVQNSRRILRQVYEASAFNRLHNDNRLAVFSADLQALSAFDCRIVVVQIIELDLHDLNLRVFGQNLFQYRRFIVKGNAHMTDFSFLLQFERRFISARFFEIIEIFSPLSVHQVKIKIVDAAGFELAFK